MESFQPQKRSNQYVNNARNHPFRNVNHLLGLTPALAQSMLPSLLFTAWDTRPVPMQDESSPVQRTGRIWRKKMRQQATKALYTHWRGLCRGAVIPDRNDLDPAQIGHLLRDVFILGADPAGVWRYRVAGTRLTALAGRELKDEPFERWWRAGDRIDANRLLTAAANDALPVIAGVKGFGKDQRHYDLEGLLLPLRHGGRTRLRMMGGFFPSPETAGKIGLRIEELGLLSLRTLDMTAATASVFGTAPANLDAMVARRSNFRVIEGGLRPPQ
jgi:hypothetical protein